MWVVYLDFTIRNTFDGKKWSIPSTVYARPLEIYPGVKLSLVDLKTELKMLGYRFVGKVERPGQVSINGNNVDIHTLGFQFPDGLEPARHVQLQFNENQITQLLSDDNAPLVRLEPVIIGGIYPSHNEDRLLVKLSDLPETLVDMLVAVEDSDFYQHHGLSFRGIARALIANIKGGGISQGASTLTQQLVKNYYLTADQTFTRKAKEAVMSLLLELHFSKEQILEGYINEIYLGQDGPRAIHGFGLASQYYFKKPLASLSIEQQATLVTLVRGASYYNPRRHPERVINRRNLVLDIALREANLNEEVVTQAKLQPLELGDKSSYSLRRYPAYLDLVRRQLKQDYNQDDLSSDGLSIFTYFDPLVQSSAESSLTKMVNKHAKDGSIENLEGAVIVSRPNTGSVIAIVGGSNASYAGFNRAVDARRAIGSLIKPAIYLTALEQPENYNLATLISDDEYSLAMSGNDSDDDNWTPQNYDHKYHGDVPLYSALVNSYNVSTARLGNTLGLGAVTNTIKRLGIEQDIAELPSLTLGAVAMSPFEVTQMYQTIAADGFYTPLLTINAVLSPQGELLKRYSLALEQRFSSESIYLLNHALQGVTHEGTGRALNWLLPDFSVAGKTGTTNDLRDSWFAGFSGDMVSVVWLGKDDNSSTGLTGSSGALRVWSEIIKERSELDIQNIPPSDIEISWVDKTTGVGSQESCDEAIPLPFILGTSPDVEIQCDNGVRQVVDWFRGILE